MEATMTETLWDRKLEMTCGGRKNLCGSCEICRTAKYNRSVTGLAPLESVGTEAYFAAIFAEARRATAPELPVEARLKVKAPKVARRAADALHPQLCVYCGRSQETGSEIHAHTLLPIVVCASCFAARSGNELRVGWSGPNGFTHRGEWAPARIGND
jgi:hypothetical protein